MKKLNGLTPERVFDFFEEISSIPHGSADMEKISDWCVEFAKNRGLRVIKDKSCNVIIFKDGALGFENAAPVILQGHLDMVCQKVYESNFDFKKDSINLIVDGDFIRADGTTLGADDGIGCAIILSLLDSSDIPHPPIEAVFTTDEEIGMFGALALDTSVLKSKRMINLDSGNMNVVTVSCAGGQDITIEIPLERIECNGAPVEIVIEGLQGGHSGSKINNNRINASILLGRVLNHIRTKYAFNIIDIKGGDKVNAITKHASVTLICNDPNKLIIELNGYLSIVKAELSACEPNFVYSVSLSKDGVYSAVTENKTDKITAFLANCSQGVIQMSSEITGLVETSQNLGIISCTDSLFKGVVSQRSSKKSAMIWLEEKQRALASLVEGSASVSSIYPPWEYKAESKVCDVWCKHCKEIIGISPKIKAIHAGLECGIFSSAINGLDCISVGPDHFDIHTPDERLSISSVEQFWKVLLSVITKLD